MPDFALRNQHIEEVPEALGSDIRFADDQLDGGFARASVGDGQIRPHPLTDGIRDEFVYAGVSSLVAVASTDRLIDSEAVPGAAFAAFDAVGGRGIVIIGDASWLGFLQFEMFSNGRFARNLALVDGPAAVPAPVTWLLAAAGMAGVLLTRVRSTGPSPP